MSKNYLALFFLALSLSVSSARAASLDFQMNWAGGRTVVQGSDLPIAVSNQLLAGTPMIDDMVLMKFIDQDSGQTLPYDGIDFNCPSQGGFNCYGSYPNFQVYGIGQDLAGSWFAFVISPTARVGTHRILVQGTSTGEGIVRTTTLTINVMSRAQMTLTPAPYLPAVPIPQKDKWESDMLLYGAHWCDQNNLNVIDQSIIYYDGPRVFYQIADYTNDPKWSATCARWMSDWYSSYVIGLNGSLQGYRVFTKGLKMDTLRTGNSNSSAAVNMLGPVGGGWYALPQHITTIDPMREASYELEAVLDNNTLHGQSYLYLQDEMAALLGQLDQVFIQKKFTWYQPFMVGLAMEALIQYYNEKDQDPRIPYIIKQTLDGLWAMAWRPEGHGFMYRCYFDGCYTPNDGSTYPPTGTFNYYDYQPNLNNLIAPAYAWMYLQTGDPKYREQADAAFGNGVAYNTGTISWAGKEFSQNYRWSFDYKKWRDQANAQAGSLPSNPAAPTIVISTPTAGSTVSGVFNPIANVFSSVNVTQVQFQIDGTNAGITVTQPPFESFVQTTLYANGAHTLTAIALDEAGHQTTSAAVPITIANPSNPSFAQCPGTIPTNAFQGCYYSYPVVVAADAYNDMYRNSNLGNLSLTRTDAAINFDWAPQTSPGPGVSTSFYGVLWQGNFNFPVTGIYKFAAAKNGGMRIYIDNQQVNVPTDIYQDIWYPLTPENPTFYQTLSAGIHQIRVEYWVSYTDAGSLGGQPAGAHLSWAAYSGSVPPPPPLLEWVSPTYAQGFATGSNILLTVRANGLGGTSIAKVDFYNGNTLIGTLSAATGDSLYLFTWPHVPKGDYVLHAVVTDTSGGMTSNAAHALTIHVADPPSSSWISPASGSRFSDGATVTFSANASAAAGSSISQVDFIFLPSSYAFASTTALDGSGHYSQTWNTTGGAGTYLISARATDNNGVQSFTPPVTLVIDGVNPIVSWVSPPNQTGFATGSNITLTVSAQATQGASLTLVEFSLDGSHWTAGTLSSGLYSATFLNVPAAAGNFWANARATDSNGKQTLIYSAIAVHDPPTIAWGTPASGTIIPTGVPAAFTGSVASATGTVVEKIELLQSGTVIGSGAPVVDGAGHYTLNWTPQAAGTFQIAARAVDNNGLRSTATSPISITVSGSSPPGTLTLPDPILNLPSTLPINGVIGLSNASSYGGATFMWSFTQVATSAEGRATSVAPSTSLVPHLSSLAAASAGTISRTSTVPQLSLASLGLTPGIYTVTVQAQSGTLVSNTATATITLVLADLSSVLVYPNPWRSDKHAGRMITFSNLPANSRVKIFTASGHLARDLGAVSGSVDWNLVNDSGERVGSGIYIYLITDGQGNKIKGKVGIIK